VLTKGQERVLGLFPVTRHPPAEPTADQDGEAVRRVQQEVMAAITVAIAASAAASASSGDGGASGGGS
jgi:hypothetical protein